MDRIPDSSSQWAFRWILFSRAFLKDKGEGDLRLFWTRAKLGGGIKRGTWGSWRSSRGTGDKELASSVPALGDGPAAPQEAPLFPRACGKTPPPPRQHDAPSRHFSVFPGAGTWHGCWGGQTARRPVAWMPGQGLRPRLALGHVARLQFFSPALIPFRLLRIDECSVHSSHTRVCRHHVLLLWG